MHAAVLQCATGKDWRELDSAISRTIPNGRATLSEVLHLGDYRDVGALDARTSPLTIPGGACHLCVDLKNCGLISISAVPALRSRI